MFFPWYFFLSFLFCYFPLRRYLLSFSSLTYFFFLVIYLFPSISLLAISLTHLSFLSFALFPPSSPFLSFLTLVSSLPFVFFSYYFSMPRPLSPFLDIFHSWLFLSLVLFSLSRHFSLSRYSSPLPSFLSHYPPPPAPPIARPGVRQVVLNVQPALSSSVCFEYTTGRSETPKYSAACCILKSSISADTLAGVVIQLMRGLLPLYKV